MAQERGAFPRRRRLERKEVAEHLAQVGQGGAAVRRPFAERGERHPGDLRVLGVLGHRRAAARLHGLQSRRAILSPSGEDDGDRARAERERGRAEERIHRGTRMVPLRSARQGDVSIDHDHVVVGGRQEEMSRPQLLAVKAMRRA